MKHFEATQFQGCPKSVKLRMPDIWQTIAIKYVKSQYNVSRFILIISICKIKKK